MTLDDATPPAPAPGFSAGVVGLFAAAAFIFGVAGGWLLHAPGECPPPPPPEPPPACPAPTEAEVDLLCAARAQSQQEALATAQTQVQSLAGQLEAKEKELAATVKELADMEKTADKAADQRAAATARAKALEGEIAGLKKQLLEATSERDRLDVELRKVSGLLREQTAATETAKGETRAVEARNVDERWSRFVAEVKVEICDRGTEKKHENCHDGVGNALTPAIRNRFKACVGSGQAMPSVGRLDKGGKLPEYAVALPDDKRLGKGWFVQLCDPSLPEK